MVLKLIEPTAGRIRLGGVDVTELSPARMWEHRRRVQIVFQDPYSSLNPRLTAGTIVGEPMENFGIAAGRGRGGSPRCSNASAFGPKPWPSIRTSSQAASASASASPRRCRSIPDVIVADEPVSALDVSVRAQVLNLMMALQDELRLAYLFVSHDLAVVRHVSHRVAVMYLGRIVELADKRSLFATPLHPYSEALLAGSPRARSARRRPSA